MMSSAKGIYGPTNLGNPIEYKITELAEMIVKLTNSKSKIINKNLPTDDPVRRKPDISRAKKDINWEPNIDVTDGLKKTIDYFKKQINRKYLQFACEGWPKPEALRIVRDAVAALGYTLP